MKTSFFSAIMLLAAAVGAQAANAPQIAEHPSSSTFATNATGRFYVKASSPDNGYLTYQWYNAGPFATPVADPNGVDKEKITKSKTIVLGGISATLTVTTPAIAGYYYYWVEITNHKEGNRTAIESYFAQAKIVNKELPDHIINGDMEYWRSSPVALPNDWRSWPYKSAGGEDPFGNTFQHHNWLHEASQLTPTGPDGSYYPNEAGAAHPSDAHFDRKNGWYTTHQTTDYSNDGVQGTTYSYGICEMALPGMYDLDNIGNGSYSAELGANAPSNLYQNIATAPGKIYEWSLDHAARNNLGLGAPQKMAIVIGCAINEESDYGPNVADRWNKNDWGDDYPGAGATLIDGAEEPFPYGVNTNSYFNDIVNKLIYEDKQTNVEDIPDGGYVTSYNGNQYYVYIGSDETSNRSWVKHSGVYSIPLGQGTTVFGFVYVYPYSSNGNILDNIVFASGTEIKSDQEVSYASAGETQLSVATQPGFAYGIAELQGSKPEVRKRDAFYDPDGKGTTAEYAISANGSGWYIRSDFSASGLITFKNLEAGKTYRLVGIPAGAINSDLGVNLTPGAVLDEGYYKDTRLVSGSESESWNLEAGISDTASAWVAVMNARSYMEYALLDSVNGQLVAVAGGGWTSSGSSRITFSGLERGKTYYFAARLLGDVAVTLAKAVATATPVTTPTVAEGRSRSLPLVMGGKGSQLTIRGFSGPEVFFIAASDITWLGFGYGNKGTTLDSVVVKILADPDTVDRVGYIVVQTKPNGKTLPIYSDTIYVLQPELRCILPKQDNMGTNFYVGFMENSESSTGLYLYATTGHKSAKVKVYASDGSLISTTDLKANQVMSVYKVEGTHDNLCGTPGYSCRYQTVSSQSLRVESDSAVSLYAYNAQYTTSEIACILPKAALSDEYFGVSYSGYARPEEELLLIATEDSTLVTITPSDRTYGTNAATDSKAPGAPFTVHLVRPGDTYLIRSRGLQESEALYVSPGLSGTHVKASRPIAVFGGNKCASVGDNCTGSCDHLFEQMLPLQAWGKQYTLAVTSPLASNIYRIVAAYDNTQVTITGQNGQRETLTLSRGKYASRRLLASASPYAYIEASQPVQVALLSESQGCIAPSDPPLKSSMGDPFLITLGAADKKLFSSTFSPVKLIRPVNVYDQQHYVTFFVEKAHTGKTALTRTTFGEFPSDLVEKGAVTFHDMPNTPYAYATVTLEYHENFNYQLSNPYGFTAYAYGYGEYESYGYLLGSQLGERMEEKGSVSKEISDTYTYCVGDAISLPKCIGGGSGCASNKRYYWYEDLAKWSDEKPLDSVPDVKTDAAGTHTYFASQMGICGILYPQQVTINVLARPAITGFKDTITVCLDAPYPQGGYDYGARPIGGEYRLNSDVFDHTRAGGGYHTVTYRYDDAQTRCYSTATAVIHVETLDREPRLSVEEGDVSFCRGDEVYLSVVNAPGRTFQWYHKDTLIPGATNRSYVVKESGSVYASGRYMVKVHNTATGCGADIDTTITIVEPPEKPKIGVGGKGSTMICVGSGYNLSDNNFVHDTKDSLYQWYRNSVSAANIIPGARMYRYTVGSDTIPGQRVFVLGAVTPVPGKKSLAEGCWSTDTIALTILPLASRPSVYPVGEQEVCMYDSLRLTASAENDVGNTYNWAYRDSSGGTNYFPLSGRYFQAKEEGVYWVESSVSAAGCVSKESSSEVRVTVRNNPAFPIIDISSTVCEGGTVTLTAIAAPPGADAERRYQWYRVPTAGIYSAIQGATDSTYGVAENGDYAVQVTSKYTKALCPSPFSETQGVTLHPQPRRPVVSGAADVCVGENNVLLYATPGVGSVAVEKYQWYKGTAQLSGSINDTLRITQIDASAPYTVEVSSAEGCTSPRSNAREVTVHDLTATILGAGSRDTCFGNSVTLQAETNVGAGGTYTWYKNGLPVQGSGTSSYTVRGTDPSQVEVASYSLRVINKHGCKSDESVPTLVTIYAAATAPAVTVSPARGVCEGESVTLVADRPTPGEYEWFINKYGEFKHLTYTHTDSSYTIAKVATSDNGQYAVTITTTDGCISEKGLVNVEVYPIPKSPVMAPDRYNVCAGDSVRIRAYSLGYSYDWYEWFADEGNGMNELSSSAEPMIYVKVAGAYTVRGHNPSGCWSARSDDEDGESGKVTISVRLRPERPDISPGEEPIKVCVRSPTFITAAAIGATSYQWYAVANGGYSSANGAVGAAKDSLEVKESGHYAACAYMGYENGLQCASDMSLPKQIQLFDVPFTPIIEGKGTACAGDTIILEAISESGDPATIASYAWSKNGNRLDFATTRTCMVTQIEDAKYTVVAISDKGCVSDASAAKDVRIRKPTVSVASDKTETCHGGSITLEAKTNTGVGSTYEWYKNDSLITNIGPICMVSGGVDPQKDQTSYYYLYVTDEQGCKSALPSNTVSVNIYGIPRPLAVKVSDPMCEGGGITLTADPSGEGTYQWFAEKSSVFEPVGIASAAAQYQLKDIRVADAGRYKVEVTNRWGCKAEGTERVVVYALPSSPMLTPGDARHLLCTGDSVVLTAYTLNSNSTYSYDWYFDNGLSRTSISSVDGRIYASMAGVYSVQSVSDHGCTSQATSEVTVEVYRKPAAPFISPDGRVTVCANGAVSITGFAAGATSYQWYTVDTATGRYGAISGAIYSSYEVGFSGRYAVRADIYYNADRTCSALSLPKEVELLPLLSPPVITGEKTAEGGEKTSGCDGDILTLTATIPESTEGASFKWYKKGSVDEDFIELPSSLAAASYTITKVEVAEYQVKAISSKGCYSEASNPKEVTIRRRPTVTIADLTEAERNPCGGTVTLTANPNPNLAGGSYEWYENGAHMENAKTSSLYVVQGNSNPQEGREASCYLYVTDRYGCRSATPSNTVVVNIHALPQTPTVTADPPQGVCHGSNATLTASPAGAGNYRWYKRLSRSLDSLIYVTSDANLRIVGALTADAGLYAVEIVNTYGCKSASKGEVGLNMLELPEVRIIETRACESWTEENTVKFATPAGGTFSGWGCANGKFNPSDVHQGTANIKYTYKAPNGCENSDEKAITIVSLPNTPIVAANGPTEVCEDSVVVTLQANVAEEYAAGYTYRWRRNGAVMPNEAASAYVARKAGAYDVQIWNDSLCWSASASDPVAISVKELPAAPLIAAQNAAFFCPGSATMLLVEKSAPGSFQWYKGDSKGMAELPAEIDSSYSAGEVGQYAVKLFGENECWSPFSNLVTMGEYPLPRQPEVVPSQSTLYVGMNYSLLVKAPQAGETYGWYRNDLATGTSGVSLTIPNLSSNDTGRYTVQAVDEHGCFVWSEAYRLAWAETQLFVPNVFTPNGDGINDYFQIVGLENFVENKLDILNSRGVVIFSQKNYANTWSGAELIGGIYYYTLGLKHEDGTSSTMRGFIHVKR